MKISNNQKKLLFQVVLVVIVALIIGISYYWFTRPAGSAVFLNLLPVFPQEQYSIFFARWFGWLPTFVHVVAFSLLTWLLMGRRHLLFACILWGSINALFEAGQALPAEIIQRLPDVFNLQAYFTQGIFDWFDLGASVIGAWAAWFVFKGRVIHQAESLDE